MSLTNIRASRRLERQRAAKRAGCPILSRSPHGQTKHARQRLQQRMPISDFPFSLKTLQEMIRRKEVAVEPARGGRLSLISKEHHFKVVTDGDVKTIIMVYKL